MRVDCWNYGRNGTIHADVMPWMRASQRQSIQGVGETSNAGYRLAADQVAQYNLGVMYGTGEGVPQDYVQAHMWFNLAASLRLTGEFGVRNRDRVADRIDPRAARRGTTPRSRVGRRAPA
jgi:hypothetical protein